MRLKDSGSEEKPKWNLMVTELELAASADLLCRYCQKQLKEGDLGYYCPKDKQTACEDCKAKDNKYNHAKRFPESFKTGHEHFFVRIRKEE